MKIKYLHIILNLAIITSLFTGCEKDDWWYDVLLGGQPKFKEDDGYLRSLNIFGILRPDTIKGHSQCFVHIERTLMSVSDSLKDDLIIIDAGVNICLIENDIITNTLNFEYSNPDSLLFMAYEYRDDDFIPAAGEKYKLICYKNGYDTVFSETIIPEKPVKSGEIIIKDKEEVTITIINDSSSFLYDAYLIDGEKFEYKRTNPSEGETTQISIPVDFALSSNALLIVYGYDRHLSEYLSFSNVFMKPGTYRPPITTVEGGFGCFGSLNFEIFLLQ